MLCPYDIKNYTIYFSEDVTEAMVWLQKPIFLLDTDYKYLKSFPEP